MIVHAIEHFIVMEMNTASTVKIDYAPEYHPK